MEPLIDDLKYKVELELNFKLPKTYPKSSPQFHILSFKGLSLNQKDDLFKNLVGKSKDKNLLGQPMLYDLTFYCQEYISNHFTITGNASLATKMQERLHAIEEEKLKREESFEAKKRQKETNEANELAQRIELDIKRKQEQIRAENEKQMKPYSLNHQKQFTSYEIWSETFNNNIKVQIGNLIFNDNLSTTYLATVTKSEINDLPLLELEVYVISDQYYNKSTGKRKLQDALKSIESLISIRNDHVVKIYATKLRSHIQANGDVIFELLILRERTNGPSTMFDLLSQCENLRTDLAIGYLTQMLSGLQAIHAKDISHQDISLHNVILIKDHTNNKNTKVKLIKPFYHRYMLNLHRSNALNDRIIPEAFLNEGWQAPESLEQPFNSRKRDIWDSGTILMMMIFGLDAESYPNPRSVLESSKEKLSKDTMSILQSMLEPSPSNRSNALQVLDKINAQTDKLSNNYYYNGGNDDVNKFSKLSSNTIVKSPHIPVFNPSSPPKQPIDQFWQSNSKNSGTSRFRTDFEEVENLGKG